MKKIIIDFIEVQHNSRIRNLKRSVSNTECVNVERRYWRISVPHCLKGTDAKHNSNMKSKKSIVKLIFRQTRNNTTSIHSKECNIERLIVPNHTTKRGLE